MLMVAIMNMHVEISLAFILPTTIQALIMSIVGHRRYHYVALLGKMQNKLHAFFLSGTSNHYKSLKSK